MKVVCIERILDVGMEPHVVEEVLADVEGAIRRVEWPPGSGSFTIRDEPGKKRGQGSGVKPIKDRCMKELEARGWRREVRVSITPTRPLEETAPRYADPGPLTP
jgi:hypothetical protein